MTAEVLEDGSVEGSECCAEDRLFADAIGQADPWRNVSLRRGDIERTGDAIETSGPQGSSVGVDTAVDIGGNRQR